jgi:hypothetical protein
MTFITQGPEFSHRTGEPWLKQWTPEAVANSNDPAVALCTYMQQVLGIGFAPVKDIAIVRKHVEELFDHYPQASYYTMCRVVQWYKANRRRYSRRLSRAYQIALLWRDALADGALPELTNPVQEFEARIRQILATETDPTWRERFLGCRPDDNARRFLIEEWEEARVTT